MCFGEGLSVRQGPMEPRNTAKTRKAGGSREHATLWLFVCFVVSKVLFRVRTRKMMEGRIIGNQALRGLRPVWSTCGRQPGTRNPLAFRVFRGFKGPFQGKNSQNDGGQNHREPSPERPAASLEHLRGRVSAAEAGVLQNRGVPEHERSK